MTASPKTFRAAARRVVLQESAQPDALVQPFAPMRPDRRVLATERDTWDALLASIASLGQYDAVACSTTDRFTIDHTHNIAEPHALLGIAGSAEQDAQRTGVPVQLRANLALADARVGTALLIAPLNGIHGADGSLVAVRCGRAFDAGDAQRATTLADIVSLEIVRGARERAENATRRQAIALFELARLGLRDEPVAERLQDMVDMLAGALDYDIAQLWQLRSGGSLRLVAARPRDPLDLEIARPRDQYALRRALDGETVHVTDASLRYLIRRTAHEILVAPLRVGEGLGGVLVLGRWRDGGESDVALADVCGDFIGKVVSRESRHVATAHEIIEHARQRGAN